MAGMLPLTAILNPSREQPESSFNSRPSSSSSANFYPFEDLDEVSIREIRKYQIHSFGRIRDSCRRIPYNTGKRDFYEKTGRTCFEVFQYDFKVPGSDTTWTVMWDYKIGLVRTTPFFKCCDYSKTISAKMLNLNPGLRDISHSITGGAIRAQGYWMPFECARAVCATFCYPIAGALIPLFGPSFPSECIPPNTQHYARMIIDPAIIQQSKREAEDFRRLYGSMPSPPTPSLSGNIPTRTHHNGYRPSGGALGYRHPERHHHGWQTGTDSDVEGSSLDRFHRLPPLQTHLPTPVLSSAESSYNVSTAHSSPRFWTAVNNSQPYPNYSSSSHSHNQHGWRYEYSKHRYHHLEPDPYRSAVSSAPLSVQRQIFHQPLPLPSPRELPRPKPENRDHQHEVRPPHWNLIRSLNNSSPRDKRTFDDYEYDAGESANGSSPEAPSPRAFNNLKTRPQIHPQARGHQSKPSEARQSSWPSPESDLKPANHESDKSRSKDSRGTSEQSESDRVFQSARDTNIDQRRRSCLKGPLALPPLVGTACRNQSVGREAGDMVDVRNRRSSPPEVSRITSTNSFDGRTANGDATTPPPPTPPSPQADQRTPSFSGAERVAALTLLHLGIMNNNKRDSERSRQGQQQEEDNSEPAELDIKPRDYDLGRNQPSIAQQLVPRSPRHNDTSSRGTAYSRYPQRAGDEAEGFKSIPSHHAFTLRRGSRDRKRKKARSM